MSQFGGHIAQRPATFVQSVGSDRLAYWVSQVGSPPVTTSAAVVLTILVLPNTWSTLFWIASYIVIAVVMPLLYILWLFQMGKVTDIHLRVREQRIRPLLVTLLAAFAAWTMLYLGAGPRLLIAFATANSLQTFLFLGITSRWKISAHTASAAGLAVLAWLLMRYTAIWFLLSVPIIAWARIRLHHHTIAQTLAGATLGGTVLAITLHYWR